MTSKTPFLSVVIPAYNAGPTLPALFASLARSSYRDFEVIIGDDNSQDVLSELYPRHPGLTITFVRLSRNRGPAGARNEAAKKAHGKVLVFLDSDVEVYPDTLKRIAEKFKKDQDLTALTGVWDKEQRTNRFFPQFKAMRDWSYWTNERDSDGYYYLFSTRIAAIRRTVFHRLGGFNETFRQMEDVELTYRIARRYAIIFASDVRVHHEFEGFGKIARKYFWRSFYWSKLWGVRRKFDPVATTMWETMAAVTGVGAAGVLGVGVVAYFIVPIPLIKTLTSLMSFTLLMMHIFLLRRFLLFCYREKGIGFMVKSLITGLVLYWIILSGAGYYAMMKRK